MNVLKEPGTRKLCSWNQIQAKRYSHLVASSISHDLEVLPKTWIKKIPPKQKRIKWEESGGKKPEFLPRTTVKAFISHNHPMVP